MDDFREFIKGEPTAVRKLDEMRPLLFDIAWAESTPNRDLYYMYRDALLSLAQKQRSEVEGFRYDITILPPIMLGNEFNKTMGHEHNSAELYEVLSGEGIYLFQYFYGNKIHKVYACNVKAGDKIFIMPAHGHLMINTGHSDLITANIAVRHRGHDYSLFIKNRGACYYAFLQNNDVLWTKNPNYDILEEIEFISPADTFKPVGVAIPEGSLHDLVTNEPKKLYFLK